MKNFNLIEMAEAMKEHKLRHMWRYAAMMALLLTLACGLAWGADYTVTPTLISNSSITYESAAEKSGVSIQNKTLYIEVPSASSEGQVSIMCSDNQASRYAYIYKTNGTVKDNDRKIVMQKTTYPNPVYFTSSDIKTEGGKYYLVFSTTDDFKYKQIKFTLFTKAKYTTSTFYPLYASTSKTAAQLISAASFHANIDAPYTTVANANGYSSTVENPYNFKDNITSGTTYYYINPGSTSQSITLYGLSNVKSIRMYGNGNGGGRTFSVTVKKVSGTGSEFTVSNITNTNAKTIVEQTTGDLTALTGYDADTYYTYTITCTTSNASHLWGIYVEAAASDHWYIYGNFSDGSTWTDTEVEMDGNVDINIPMDAHDYAFKIKHTSGASIYYSGVGDGSYMSRDNHTDWYFNGSYNCGLRTDIGGTYNFALSIDGETPVVTVTYPTGVAVTLDYNYSSLTYTWQAKSGYAIPTPNFTPERSGFSFEGWYSDAECTTKWEFPTPINSSQTLYARWEYNWYYKDAWIDSWALKLMTRSADGAYWYYEVDKSSSNREFGIEQNSYFYNRNYVHKNYMCTDIGDMADPYNQWGGNDNCWVYYNTNQKFYILVFPPHTVANNTDNPKICASTYLPSASEKYYEVPSGRKIYFDNSDRDWDNVYFRKGHACNTAADLMTLVTGTDALYEVTLASAYYGYQAFNFADNSGWQGSNKIFQPYYDGGIKPNDEYAITEATVFQKYNLDGDFTFTPGDADGDPSNGCQYYAVAKTFGMKKDNVSITAPTNGSISVTYTSGSGGTLTSGNADLAHTSILTISATGATGYDLDELTVNEAAHTSGNTYVLSEDAVVAATFTLHDYNVTYSAPSNGNYTIKVADGTASSASKTANYGQTITLAASPAEGYAFSSWTVSKAGGGTETVTDNQFSMPADDVTITASFTAIPVSSISLSPTSATLVVGGSTQTITPTVSPSNALDKAITWSSSAEGVATVSSSGVVTAVAPGTATITATAHDGSGVTQTCSITVKCSVTYAANNGSATGSQSDGSSPYAKDARVTVKDQGTMALTNYQFVGWNTAANGSGTWYSPGANFAISANTTLNAQWRSTSSTTCPGSEGGTVFSLSMGSSVTSSDLDLAAGVTKNLASYATITNGAAHFTNINKSGVKATITKDSPNKLSFGGNDAMLVLYLDCALEEGDVISYTGDDNQLSFTTSTSRSTTPATTSKSYTIPAESSLIGAHILYVWRSSGSTTQITALTITRPVDCTDPALEYDETSVDVTYGDDAFTNTLTNSYSASVSYESGDDDVVTVDSDGEVTIVGAGSTTITASISGDATYCDDEVSYTVTVAKADLSVSPAAGTASSVTHNSATLPFTLSTTTGVASVTLKVYNTSDVLVKTVSGVTAATSGSGNVTGLTASTTYYYTVTPIGDANHNDGAASSKSSTFTTAETPSLTAMETGTLYKVEDMVPESITLSETGQYANGLSANAYFEVIGDPSKTDGDAGTPEMKNESASFADQSFTARMYLKGASQTSGSGTTFVPTSRAIKFIIPTTGLLDIYAHRVDRLYLKKAGDSGTTQLGTSTSGSGSKVTHMVTAGTYYIYSVNSSTCIYGMELTPCYTLTLDKNNSDDGSTDGSEAYVIEEATAFMDGFTAPTRSGYAVTGYYAESGCTTLVADAEGNLEEDVTVSEVAWTDEDGKWVKGSNATLYAKWGAVYTVTFNTNGGSSVDAITQASVGASITMPAAPTKSGYTFAGWQIGSSYAAGASYTPIANVTAYATWKAECGYIKWDFTEYTEDDITLTEGASTEYTADDGETKMRYTAGSGDKIIAPNKGKLGYFKENGSTGSGSYKDVDGTTPIGKTRLIRLFVEAGSGTLRINCNGDQNGVYKVLDGSASGTTLISSLSANTTSSSITLTTSPLWIETTTKGYINDIRWTPASAACYHVTYNGNGATGGYVNDPTAYDDENNDVTVLANGFTRTGYEFIGWNTEDDGSGETYQPGATITDIDDDVTLYAQWRVLISSDNTNFSDYTSVGSTDDVRVTNGATLTITSTRTIHDIIVDDGATLNVSTNSGSAITFTVNSLNLKGGWNAGKTKYDMPRVYIDPASTLTKTNSTVNLDISVDANNYYPIAVPYPVNVSAVDYVNSTLATASQYGKHYVIKKYDGANRAESGEDRDNNWVIMKDGTIYGDATETLQPGVGYILTAVSIPAYGGGVIRFPMTVADGWTTKGEQGTYNEVTKNEVEVEHYTGTASAGNTRHEGWNLLGVPYMSCFASKDNMDHEEDDAFITGKMVITGDPADPYGGYDDGVVYVTVPTHDFSEYLQYAIDEGDTKLLPSWCFFVQFAKSGTLTFEAAGEATSGLPIYAPKREDIAPIVKTGIVLSGNDASDKTTFIISDRYSASTYEVNADLEKMFGNGYTLATYSLSGSTRLAYNAMSNADARNIIPIGYRAPADGDYTFSINPRYAENFEQVNLIDYETGIMTNLLLASYTFSTERAQNDARFALNVVPRQETPTDIENGAGINDANGVRKVLINDKLYIILDGKMYDATGKSVK